MSGPAPALLAALAVIACGLGAVAWLSRAPQARAPSDLQPRSVPVLAGEGPLRLTVLGTSLTSRYDWPEVLSGRLEECLRHPVAVETVAGAGENVDWGARQVEAVARTEPDLVLTEFAINDADLLDGVRLSKAREVTSRLVGRLSETGSEGASVVLMSMSPAQGLRGWLRPRLAAHYRSYGEIAGETGAGFLDLYARWLALPREERGLDEDGLHPASGRARDIIVPAATRYLAALFGRKDCEMS